LGRQFKITHSIFFSSVKLLFRQPTNEQKVISKSWLILSPSLTVRVSWQTMNKLTN